jgi:broad specificity phosphatase PhoE
MNRVYLPVFKSWRLNERNYGALTGLSKKETAEKLGHELVQDWRGSLRTRPPALTPSSTYWPGKDRKYADLTADQIPLTESLMDCMNRAAPILEEKILYEIRNGKNVMVVAHANTIRGLVKILDNIEDNDICDVSIPTGIPIIYKFNRAMETIPPSADRQTASQIHMKGLFLEKPGLLQEALKKEKEWQYAVPGYSRTMERNKSPMSSLERSLFKLKAERELGVWAGQFIDPNAIEEDDGNDGNSGRPMQLTEAQEDKLWEEGLAELESGDQFDPDGPSFHRDQTEDDDFDEISVSGDGVVASLISNHPCLKPMPSASVLPGMGSVPVRQGPVIVIIRHGTFACGDMIATICIY